MKKSTALYERAKNMVLADNFGAFPEEFVGKLGKLMSDYFVYDGMQLATDYGAENNLLLCVSVKRVKPVRTPTK